jgi:hypothetical protein
VLLLFTAGITAAVAAAEVDIALFEEAEESGAFGGCATGAALAKGSAAPFAGDEETLLKVGKEADKFDELKDAEEDETKEEDGALAEFLSTAAELASPAPLQPEAA